MGDWTAMDVKRNEALRIDCFEPGPALELVVLSEGDDLPDVKSIYLEDTLGFSQRVPYLGGAWILVDRTSGKIYSSPAFPGAYWDCDTGLISTGIIDIIRRRKSQGLRIWNDCSMLWAICKESSIHGQTSAVHLPVLGVRILSGMMRVGDFKDSQSLMSLLPLNGKKFVSYKDFREAMFGAAEELSNQSQSFSVAFSGGKDCSAVAGALSKIVGRKNVRLKHASIYADDGNMEQARSVSEALGLELDVISPKGDWPYGDSEDEDLLLHTLSHSLTEVTAPYHTVCRVSDSMVVDGQSIDGALCVNMNKAKQKNVQFSVKADLIESAKNYPRSFMLDGQPQIRHTVASTMAALQRLRGHNIEKSGHRGDDLVRQKARVLYKKYPARPEFSCVRDLLELDIRVLDRMFSENRHLKQIYYHVHPAQKSLYSNGIFHSPPVHFPYLKSFSDVWASGVSGRDMMDPKWQVRKFLDRDCGVKYDLLPFDSPSGGGLKKSVETKFAIRYISKFLSEGFLVVDLIPEDLRDIIIGDIKELYGRLKLRTFSHNDFMWAYRLLNYEFLAREV